MVAGRVMIASRRFWIVVRRMEFAWMMTLAGQEAS
jgi:hypothetical protein